MGGESFGGNVEVGSEGIGGDQQNADASRVNGVSDGFEPILAALNAAIIS